MKMVKYPNGFEENNLGQKKPLEIIDKALQAWGLKNFQEAEKYFLNGINAYRIYDPSGIDYALGRYGAYLLFQDRIDEAAEVIEEALSLETKIPTIWQDYLLILTRRRDLPGLFAAVDLMQKIGVLDSDLISLLIGYSRRTGREGNLEFVETLFKRAMAEFDARSSGYWAAIGAFGYFFEKAGRIQDAINTWSQAFSDGSNDPLTINRLSLSLERSKEYIKAVEIIQDALTRGLPSDLEEQLRKRMSRCEGNINSGQKRGRDVLAFSERDSLGIFKLFYQLRTKPSIDHFNIVGNIAYCMGFTKGIEGTLMFIDLNTGKELQRREGLPAFETRFTPEGYWIGIERPPRVGGGPSLFWLMDNTCAVLAKKSIPDAITEIVYSANHWYVGSRNGLLYVFDMAGDQQWAWAVPGSGNFKGSPYECPCPYHIAVAKDLIVTSSMGELYGVSSNGDTLWHVKIPNENEKNYGISIPISITNEDTMESSNFNNTPAVKMSFKITGPDPLINFIVMHSDEIIVGSSQGRLYQFNKSGRICNTRVLGETSVQAIFHLDGSLAVAYCDEKLAFFSNNEIIKTVDWSEHLSGLKMLDKNLIVWGNKKLNILNKWGERIYSIEFSKAISNVAVYNDMLICSAGVLTAFRST